VVAAQLDGLQMSKFLIKLLSVCVCGIASMCATSANAKSLRVLYYVQFLEDLVMIRLWS